MLGKSCRRNIQTAASLCSPGTNNFFKLDIFFTIFYHKLNETKLNDPMVNRIDNYFDLSFLKNQEMCLKNMKPEVSKLC